MYLAIALQLALDHMPTKTWKECCDETIIHVKNFHELLGGDDDDSNQLCGGKEGGREGAE